MCTSSGQSITYKCHYKRRHNIYPYIKGQSLERNVEKSLQNDLDLCDSYIWNKYIMYIMTLYSKIENLADIKIFVSVNMDTLNTRY